jgi:hypothetical protein
LAPAGGNEGRAGETLGDPDGEGEGDPVGLGVPVGVPDGEADGVGEGLGVGETEAPIVCPAEDAIGKLSTGFPVSAPSMKSCQIAAGMVPP